MAGMTMRDVATRSAEDELTDVAGVFALLDREREGFIERALATDALQCCGIMPAGRVVELVGGMAEVLDVRAFYDCTKLITAAAAQEAHQRSFADASGSSSAVPTIGSALLGMLDFLRKDGLRAQDFRLAHHAKSLSDLITGREELRRHQSIADRQESALRGVKEAHMQQAVEFNAAWSSNMDEFKRQAVECEEQLQARDQLYSLIPNLFDVNLVRVCV